MLPAVPGIQCVLMAMHAARFQHYNQATLREPASSPSVKSTRGRAIGEEVLPKCLKIQEKKLMKYKKIKRKPNLGKKFK
jgi:hypothetical protein